MDVRLVTADGVELPRVTISIGGAVFGGGGDEPAPEAAALLAAADANLYASKKNGRNQVTF